MFSPTRGTTGWKFISKVLAGVMVLLISYVEPLSLNDSFNAKEIIMGKILNTAARELFIDAVKSSASKLIGRLLG